MAAVEPLRFLSPSIASLRRIIDIPAVHGSSTSSLRWMKNGLIFPAVVIIVHCPKSNRSGWEETIPLPGRHTTLSRYPTYCWRPFLYLFCFFFGEGSPRNRVCACQRRPINAHRFTARAPSPKFVMRRAYWRCHRVILVRGVGPLVPILFDNNKLVGTGVCVLFISPSVIKYLAGKNRNGRWSIIDEP